MGLLDFLFLGALLNSGRNKRQSNNNHSNFSSDSYNRGYEDGYDDCCMDHNDFSCQDEYGYHDDCDCGYDNNSYDDCYDDDFYDF